MGARQILDEFEKMVLSTIAYTDQFEYPLTFSEIKERLIAQTDFGKQAPARITAALQSLQKKQYLQKDGLYYFLWGRKHLVTVRQARQSHSQQLRQELAALQRHFGSHPWIEAFFVTGSLAMNNAVVGDDIDIMVVTRSGRLWLTRLVVLLTAQFLGKRRSWAKEEPDSWCFNLWLESSSLAMPMDKQTLYTAYELCQAEPLFDHHTIAQRLLAENTWVQQHLPNFFSAKFSSPKQAQHHSFWLTDVCLSVLNLFAYILQRLYMYPHQTSERVSLRAAFFHPRDTKRVVMASMERRLAYPIQGETVVLVTGVFDILHQEHIGFLRDAACLGTKLLVGVEGDERVRSLKGPGRPINTLTKRIAALTELGIATEVFALPEQFSSPADREALIARIRPKYLAVSAHTAHLEKKRALLQKYGGAVVVVREYNPHYSSTNILQKKSATIQP